MIKNQCLISIILEACQKAVKLVLSKEHDYALMQMLVKSSA